MYIRRKNMAISEIKISHTFITTRRIRVHSFSSRFLFVSYPTTSTCIFYKSLRMLAIFYSCHFSLINRRFVIFKRRRKKRIVFFSFFFLFLYRILLVQRKKKNEEEKKHKTLKKYSPGWFVVGLDFFTTISPPPPHLLLSTFRRLTNQTELQRWVAWKRNWNFLP